MVDRTGQQLGNYRVIRLIGRGGFADVYLGEHIYLKTQVAIKVLQTKVANDEDLEGFLKEARTIAHLVHPNIVRVMDFGVDAETPFLVMDYAPNGSLRQRHPKGAPLPLTTITSYVKQIAAALQHAHDEKLIHRDVKPENMLLGSKNNVLLSDFGIALIAQSSRYQNTQDVVGTVAYMSPEQIQGKPRPASDQYSLGIVVYEWLSGDRPFHGSFTELCTQHMFATPPPLREKVPTVPPDVEQVVITALAKDPKQRFGSVQAFANALEQASQSQIPTILGPQPSPQSSSALFPTQAAMTPLLPSEQPEVAPPLPPTQLARVSPPRGTPLCTYRGHSDRVAWSPDGTLIASVGNDGIVWVWDAGTGRNFLYYNRHSAEVSAVAWSPDGTRIASAGKDRTVQVWEAVPEGKVFTYRGHSTSVKALAWSPDGTRIASAGDDKTVQVWEAETGNNAFIYRGHSASVKALAWSPDGTRIASAGFDNTVQVWQVS